MTLSEDLITAFQPDVTHVMGVRLRPFSLGHLILLRRCQSPLLEAKAEISYADFLEAVFICSRSYERATSELNTRQARRLVKRPHWFRSWFGLRSVKWHHAAHLLCSHIRDGQRYVRVSPKGSGDSGTVNSPFLVMLAVHLMRQLHQSFSEVMNQPLRLSHWLYAAAIESMDAGSVVDEDEQRGYEEEAQKINEELNSGKRRFPMG